MKIQYASDLHLEFSDNGSYLKHNPLQVSGNILILAGDIGYLGDDNYSKHPFWDWASENYQQVIIALGNHEFYKKYSKGNQFMITYAMFYAYFSLNALKDYSLLNLSIALIRFGMNVCVGNPLVE